MKLKARTWFIRIFIVIVFVVLIFALTIKIFAAHWIKNKVEVELSLALNAKVNIEKFDISPRFPSLFPITIVIQKASLKRANEYSIQIGQLSGQFDLTNKNLRLSNLKPIVTIAVDNIDFEYEIPLNKGAATTESSKIAPANLRELAHAPPQIEDLNISLVVNNLNVDIKKQNQSFIKTNRTALKLDMTSFFEPIALKVDSISFLNNPLLPVWIPWSLSTLVSLKESKIQMTSAQLNVFDLVIKTQGIFDLTNETFAMDSSLLADDLSKIPMTLKGFPIKAWAGAIDLKFKAQGSIAKPKVDGQFKLSKSKFQVEFKPTSLSNVDVDVNGEIRGDLDSAFSWDSEIKVPKLLWNFDLSQMDLRYSDLFHKPKSIELKTMGQVSWGKDLRIDNFKLQFASLEAQASGVLQNGSESNLNIQILPTDLGGFEKFFKPLAQFPITGRLALKANLNGSLDKKDSIRVNVNNLKLENFSTTINYQNKDLKLNGPLFTNIIGSISLQGTEVLDGNFDLSGDFSKLKVKYTDQFSKESGDIAKIKLNGQKIGRRLQLRSSQIQIPGGVLDISGEPPLQIEDKFQLLLQTNGIDTQKLLKWFPKYEKLFPKLNVKTKLDLSGKLNSKDILLSPLQTRGTIEILIPQLVLPKLESKEQTTLSSDSIPKKPTALLQDKPIFRGLDVKLLTQISDFSMPPIKAQGIQTQISIINGLLSAKGSIRSAFEGKVELKNIEVPLFVVEPNIKFAIASDGLRIEQLLEGFLPQYAKLIQAQSKTEIKGQSPWPSSAQFIEKLSAQGKLQLSNGTLSTIEISNMLKELIGKIPQAKPEMISSRGPIQISEGLIEFKMEDGKILLNPLTVLSNRQEELSVAGNLDLKLNVNLNGKIALVDNVKSLGSFFEANKDAKERLVIPLSLTGNAMKPELKMAQDAIGKMLQKTLEFEKNKAVDNIKKQVAVEAQKQVDQQKKEIEKNLGDEVKKRLDGLFR